MFDTRFDKRDIVDYLLQASINPRLAHLPHIQDLLEMTDKKGTNIFLKNKKMFVQIKFVQTFFYKIFFKIKNICSQTFFCFSKIFIYFKVILHCTLPRSMTNRSLRKSCWAAELTSKLPITTAAPPFTSEKKC